MKQIIKFFILILLFFATTVSVSCLAYNDCRFVRNPEVIKSIKSKIEPLKKELGVENLYICYDYTIFMVDSENSRNILVSTSVLIGFSRMIGEVVTTVEIQETEKIDINSVLSYFTSDSSSFKLNYGQPKFLRVPSGDQNKNSRHVSASLFAILLKDFEIKEGDRVYFMVTNSNIEDISIIHETCEGVKTIFKFQPPFGIVKLTAKPAEPPIPPSHKKLFNSTPNVARVGFLERMLSAVWGCFWGEEGYARVPADDSDDSKLKLE